MAMILLYSGTHSVSMFYTMSLHYPRLDSHSASIHLDANRNRHTNNKAYIYIIIIYSIFVPNVRKLMSILIIQIKDAPNNIGDIDPIVRAHFAHKILANMICSWLRLLFF